MLFMILDSCGSALQRKWKGSFRENRGAGRRAFRGYSCSTTCRDFPQPQWVWVPPENRHIQRKGKKIRHALGARHIKPCLEASIATVRGRVLIGKLYHGQWVPLILIG